MFATGTKPLAISNLLTEYVSVLKQLYGAKLKKVILFGSYARGDFGPESDIDIMILWASKIDPFRKRNMRCLPIPMISTRAMVLTFSLCPRRVMSTRGGLLFILFTRASMKME